MDSSKLAEYVGSKIKEFRLNRGMTQEDLAVLMNTTKQSIGRYEKGSRGVNQDLIFELAEIFNCSIDDFFPTDSNEALEITSIYNQLDLGRKKKVYNFAERQLEEQSSELEYYGYTAAGAPIENQQVPTIYSNQTDVSLLVSGDSMESLYHDGDVITYRKQQSLENGEIGVFVLNNGITMKKFKRTENEILLRSLNDKYEDIIVTEKDDFAILGKVIK